MLKSVMISVLLWCGVAAEAGVIFRSDPVAGAAVFDGWRMQKYGDAGSEVVALPVSGAAGAALSFIRNAGDRNWCYLIRDFAPGELGEANRIRVRLALCSNRPELVMAVIAEGVTWGGDYERCTAGTIEAALEWSEVTVELERYNPDKFMSVAVGLDYNRAGVWCGIGRIVVEALRPEETPVELAAFSAPAVNLPPAWLGASVAESREALDEYRQYYQLLGAARGRDEELERELDRWQQLLEQLAAGSGTLESWKQLELLRSELGQWQYASAWIDELAGWDDAALLPPGRAEPRKFRSGCNMRETAVLLLANNSVDTAGFELRLTGSLAKLTRIYTARKVDGAYDCLVPLPPDGVVELGRQQVEGVILELATAPDTASGVYTGELAIVPFDGRRPEQVIPLELEVLPVTRPETLPLAVMQWDYAAGLEPAMMALLHESGVNVLCLPLGGEAAPANFAVIDRAVAAFDRQWGRGNYTLFFETWFIRNANGWRPEFTAWLDALAAACAKNGLGYDDWILHIYDELLNDEFYDAAQAIKAHNPDIRIFSDKLVPSVETIRQFAAVVDFWSPITRKLHIADAGTREAFAAMRASGLPVWGYNCDAVPGQALTEYRLQPWLAWVEDLHGISFWTAKTLSWRSGTGARNYGMHYPAGDGAYYRSRRGLQWQIGLEEYGIFSSLPDSAETEQLRREIREVLRNADAKDTGSRMNEIRQRALALLMEQSTEIAGK